MMDFHLWITAKILRRICANAKTCTIFHPVRQNPITRRREYADDGLHFHEWRCFHKDGVSLFRLEGIAGLMENEIIRRKVFRYQLTGW